MPVDDIGGGGAAPVGRATPPNRRPRAWARLMLLAIDVGNTNTVFGLYDGERLTRHWRVETDPTRTVDEHRVLLRGLLGADAPAAIDGAAMTCVVPAATDTLRALCRRELGVELLVVQPGVRTGMPILYETPHTLGSDRLVNAVAGYERTHAATIVVDFGTATKIEFVTPAGQYAGGVICPGVRIAGEALFAGTARLHQVALQRPPQVIGRTTTHAIQSGLLLGHAATVDGLVRRIEREQSVSAHVIATGGLCHLLAAESETIREVDEFLTLDGLRVIFARNTPRRPAMTA
jgi:type III pantothenate kinase